MLDYEAEHTALGRATTARRTRRAASLLAAKTGRRDPMVVELDIADDVVALGARREIALPVALDDHKNHASCNPCTKACPVCHWTTILSGYEFHVKACAAKKEQNDKVIDPVRGPFVSTAVEYPAGNRELEKFRATEVGQTSDRIRRANGIELREQIANGKPPTATQYLDGPRSGAVDDVMDHTVHVTCCLIDNCAMCTIACVVCGHNVLATGYHQHRAKCTAQYIGRTQGGGDYKSKVTAVLEEYGNEPLFATLRTLPPRDNPGTQLQQKAGRDAKSGAQGVTAGGGSAASSGGDYGSGGGKNSKAVGSDLANMLRKQKKMKKKAFRHSKRLR
jgi:hypothetical protein